MMIGRHNQFYLEVRFNRRRLPGQKHFGFHVSREQGESRWREIEQRRWVSPSLWAGPLVINLFYWEHFDA